jgi:hypothetical protein
MLQSQDGARRMRLYVAAAGLFGDSDVLFGSGDCTGTPFTQTTPCTASYSLLFVGHALFDGWAYAGKPDSIQRTVKIRSSGSHDGTCFLWPQGATETVVYPAVRVMRIHGWTPPFRIR